VEVGIGEGRASFSLQHIPQPLSLLQHVLLELLSGILTLLLLNWGILVNLIAPRTCIYSVSH
jgi:hypothetical protein